MVERTVRSHSREVKEAAVHRLEAGEPLRQVAEALGVRRKLLYDWRKAYQAHGIEGFKRRGRTPKPPSPPPDPEAELKAANQRIAALERKIGQQAVELDFFRKALQDEPSVAMPASQPTSTRSSKP